MEISEIIVEAIDFAIFAYVAGLTFGKNCRIDLMAVISFKSIEK